MEAVSVQKPVWKLLIKLHPKIEKNTELDNSLHKNSSVVML